MTHVAAQQTAAAVRPLRAVANEIVIGLDERLVAKKRAYEEFADRVLVLPSGPIEPNLSAIHSACTHDWIFRIDSDEIPSPALVDVLPELLADPTVRQYAFARRWLIQDNGHWLDEALWWPDFQVRLIRKDAACFSGIIHATVGDDSHRVLVIEPLLHLDCLLNSVARRQTKLLNYEASRPGGFSSTREPLMQVYEPERFARRPPAPLPEEEHRAVQSFFDAAGRSVASGRPAAVPASTKDHAPRASDAEVNIDVLETDLQFDADVARFVTVRIINTSNVPWEDPDPTCAFAASYHWRWPDGSALDGIRTEFVTPLYPGDARIMRIHVMPPSRLGAAWLDLGVVHERVRWLPGESRISTNIQTAGKLPDRREPPIKRRRGRLALRRPRRAIPRVLHRVWLGGRPLPPEHDAYGDTWRALHPGWEMRLWTDATAPTPPGVERARNLAERSDLVRYEVLRRHGGVYVDTDVECLRPIDDLIRGITAFAAYEVPGRLCNAVLGACPHHPAFERAAQLASITVGRGSYPEATATNFLTFVLESFDDVALFGPERFYPTLWDGTTNVGADPPYAVHHWAKSWDPVSS